MSPVGRAGPRHTAVSAAFVTEVRRRHLGVLVTSLVPVPPRVVWRRFRFSDATDVVVLAAWHTLPRVLSSRRRAFVSAMVARVCVLGEEVVADVWQDAQLAVCHGDGDFLSTVLHGVTQARGPGH